MVIFVILTLVNRLRFSVFGLSSSVCVSLFHAPPAGESVTVSCCRSDCSEMMQVNIKNRAGTVLHLNPALKQVPVDSSHSNTLGLEGA